MAQEPVPSGAGFPAVRAARRGEAALLGQVLADAFADDPVFAWLIPRSCPAAMTACARSSPA